MNKLLIDDYPIQVLPKLAEKIGLNEAIVLQQMHYWLNNSKHSHEGTKWIYNSYPNWQKQFPFWSERTVKRVIKNLEKQELLLIGNYNKHAFDRTKWYSINYEALNNLLVYSSGQNDPTQSDKLAPSERDKLALSDEDKMSRPIPETTQKTTTEITTKTTTKSKVHDDNSIPYKEIILYLNEKTGKRFNFKANGNRKLIKARFSEGYTLADFKKVIDNKVSGWIGTEWEQYLKPDTLFSNKFDKYLNEKVKEYDPYTDQYAHLF